MSPTSRGAGFCDHVGIGREPNRGLSNTLDFRWILSLLGPDFFPLVFVPPCGVTTSPLGGVPGFEGLQPLPLEAPEPQLPLGPQPGTLPDYHLGP